MSGRDPERGCGLLIIGGLLAVLVVLALVGSWAYAQAQP